VGWLKCEYNDSNQDNNNPIHINKLRQAIS